MDSSQFVLVACFVISLIWLLKLVRKKKQLPFPPAVGGGWPLIGNLLQLREKKPAKTFMKWTDKYGPIFTVKMGASATVVINSSDLAREAMITRYSSISSRKLPNAIQIMSDKKFMVSIGDYGEEYKKLKRYLLTSVLGSAPQKRFRPYREELVENLVEKFHAEVAANPGGKVRVRDLVTYELVGLALKQIIGKDLQSLYVKELGTEISKMDIHRKLLEDSINLSLEPDWRDFFPYLGWVPNKEFERKIKSHMEQREAIMKALIDNRMKDSNRLSQEPNSYLDFLLKEAKELTEKQLRNLIWEGLLISIDTTLFGMEWAMFELARNPECQERLYQEIKEVCGESKAREDLLPRMPHLNAVFHELQRKHSSVSILPTRYAHEDTQIGGYHISAGTQVAINIYACNMDAKEWDEPEKWKPERFLKKEFEIMDIHRSMAFGAGKRACIGGLQFTAILCTAMARFLQEFKWSISEDDAGDENTFAFTSQRLNPLEAIIVPRTPDPYRGSAFGSNFGQMC